MDASGVLWLQLQLLLHLSQVPARQLVIDLIAHLATDMGNLLIQVALNLLLLLHILLDGIRQDVV